MNRRLTDQYREVASIGQSLVLDQEREHLADDLLSLTRLLYRLRPDLLRHQSWMHVEAACIELNRAWNALKLRR